MHTGNPEDDMGSMARIVGVDVDLISTNGLAVTSGTLVGIAEHTAFRIKSAIFLSGGASGAQTVRIRCMLKAPGGIVGDAQLFDLLRRIGTTYRWVHVVKLWRDTAGALYAFPNSSEDRYPVEATFSKHSVASSSWA